MKKVFLLLLLTLNFACTNRSIYFGEKHFYSKDEIRNSIKKVAILPVNYVFNEDYSNKYVNQVFSNRDNENLDPVENQKTNGLKLQKIIYQEFVKSKPETVWLSDKDVNAILDEKKIKFHDLRRLSKPEIASILNVDAVLYLDVFVGAITQQNPVTVGAVPLIYQNTKQQTEFTIELHSVSENDLVWKAKTILGKKALKDEAYFRQIMQSELAPILPLN